MKTALQLQIKDSKTNDEWHGLATRTITEAFTEDDLRHTLEELWTLKWGWQSSGYMDATASYRIAKVEVAA